MRIIAGTYRSRRLEAPAGLGTRPTSDRLRETLFNVLAPRMDSPAGRARFLDLYAGSGAVGLEAVSRGAGHVTFVERSPAALKVLRHNLASLRIESGVAVRAESVGAFLSKSTATPMPHEVVFLDPPYDAEQEYAATLRMLGGGLQPWLAPRALVIAEHRRKQALDERYVRLERTRVLEQGDAALSFYEVVSASPGLAADSLP